MTVIEEESTEESKRFVCKETNEKPKMASIDKELLSNLSKPHLLYAQEMYLARVKRYESSCKGTWELIDKIGIG